MCPRYVPIGGVDAVGIHFPGTGGFGVVYGYADERNPSPARKAMTFAGDVLANRDAVRLRLAVSDAGERRRVGRIEIVSCCAGR